MTLAFPGEPQEVWVLCRQHDRSIKRQAVASRPRAETPTEERTTVEVCCGACQRSLDERSDLPAEQRQPCPSCGSMTRLHKVGLHATLTLRESLRARAKRPGKGGWLQETRSGDDYTRV